MTAALNALEHAKKVTTTRGKAPDVGALDAPNEDLELELALPGQSGVLRELALDQWRGLASRTPNQRTTVSSS